MGFDQYHEPPEELPARTRTFARLCASLTEEAEAIGWYEQRIAVDLVGLSYGEAGRLLGVREATITTRLYRARQRVAQTLTGNDRSAAAS